MDNLSIIIPVGLADQSWRDLTTDLLKSSFKFEIILIGPDFKSTISTDPRLNFYYSKAGRALQQNLGALKSTKENLWFLHADSKLTSRSLQKIEEKLIENPNAIFFFDLSFLSDGPNLMVLNSLGAYWRSRILKMPFGDQGFFMAKKTFISLGLYNEKVKYGEDHQFIWRAHQQGVPVLPCSSEIFTSARKYQKLGWLTTTFMHFIQTYKQALPEFLIYLTSSSRHFKKNSTAIAIFVKTPGLSIVKSRLAKVIGKEKAEEFFLLSIKATEALVIETIKKRSGSFYAYWAIAEKESLNNPLWYNFETIYQGNGELGDRLATVYSQLQKKHKKVFLIGADSPHVNFKTFFLAQLKLSTSAKYVLGETEDGGFYLFGGKGIITRAKWNAIPYSQQKTAMALIQNLGKSHFTFLDKNFDIDYAEDLIKLSKLSTVDLLPEQVAVIEWAKNAVKNK